MSWGCVAVRWADRWLSTQTAGSQGFRAAAGCVDLNSDGPRGHQAVCSTSQLAQPVDTRAFDMVWTVRTMALQTWGHQHSLLQPARQPTLALPSPAFKAAREPYCLGISYLISREYMLIATILSA